MEKLLTGLAALKKKWGRKLFILSSCKLPMDSVFIGECRNGLSAEEEYNNWLNLFY